MNKNRKKITHITRFAYPHIGGVEAVINQINESLPDDEFEKEIFCCSNSVKSSVENGVKYNRCRYLFYYAANLISPQLLFRMIGLKTDIIHFHMPVIQNVIIWFILYHLGLIKYKKMVISYHGSIIGYDSYMRPFWTLYKYFLSKADIIHVLAPTSIDNDDILLKNKEKCIIIPFGIDLNPDFDENTYNKIKQENRRVVLSVGRLVELKGFNYIMEAVKDLDNIRLYIMGDGSLRKEYETYIKSNNLQDKIVILGEIRDERIKNAYYKACDVLVVASIRTESFGITQLEAMRYSKPVINTNLGTGMNYVSINEETGLTVEPANTEELKNAINRLLENDELRNIYGQNARKRAENLFNIETIRKRYKELYCDK